MRTPDSYTRSGRFAQHGDVVVDRAVDPVTGLPVLVYRFPGAPVAAAAAIDSDDVWQVLEQGVDSRGGYVVSNLVEGTTPLSERPAWLDDYAAERAFTAVAAATAAGAVHGDLRAERIHRRGSQIWIEGYGVPWADGAAADDARSLARSLVSTDGHALSSGALAALQRAAEDGDAAATAASLGDLAARARRAAGATPTTPAAGGAAGEGAGGPGRKQRNAAPEAFGHVRIDAAASAAERRPPAHEGAGSSPAARPARRAPAARAPTTPRTKPRTSGPNAAGAGAGAGSKESGPRFSKAPPPDVTYRSGGDDGSGRHAADRVGAVVASVRDRRRVWLLGLLVVAAIALALVTVTVTGQRGAPPAGESVSTGGAFVIDVRVSPARLPPVSLLVVASPPGSRQVAGTVIRTVPDKVQLDREGTWQFQGRFEGRHSEIVTVVVPTDGPVILPFSDVP